ncbi:hypothetical protein B0H66DRAFT_459442, partial [Apodospora peruviana]
MKASYTSILLALQALSVVALPRGQNRAQSSSTAVESVASTVATVGTSTTAGAAASGTASVTSASATATAGAGAGAGEEEKAENEVEQEGQFGTVINLGGGDVKTDTEFPPGVIGRFEVEFQNAQARLLRVTENKTPAAPPPGFTALEPVSYIVEIGGGASTGFTLSKIDYIRNADSTVDIRTGQIGKLCKETNSFVIGAGVGELEFEDDENELTLTVKDLVGEWAMFLPDAAAAGGAGGAGAGAAAGEGATAGEGAATGGNKAASPITAGCEAGTLCRSLLDAI